MGNGNAAIKIFAIALAYTLCCCLGAPCVAAEPEIEATRPVDCQYTEAEWKPFLQFVQKTYPARVAMVSKPVLIVQVPVKGGGALFALADWSPDEKASSKDGGGGLKYVLTDKVGGSRIEVSLELKANSSLALGSALAASVDIHGSSARPSTWGGRVKPLSLGEASFVGHYNEAPGNLLIAQMANAVLRIRSFDSAEHPVLLSEFDKLGSQLSSVLGPTRKESLQEDRQDHLSVTVRGRTDKGEWLLTWTATDAFSGYWVRMDVDSGVLSIEDKGTVRVGSVPDTGANVDLYAISSDGKTWFQKKFRIPPGK